MSRKKATSSATARIPTELHNFAAFWVHRLSGEVLSRFERSLLEYDVTHAQWLLMNTLFCGTANMPSTISGAIGIDPGAISRAADRLALKGLVARCPHPEDKRAVTLVLTERGESVMHDLIAIADEQDAAWLAALTATERRQFLDTLSKLLVAMDVDVPSKLSARTKSRAVRSRKTA